MSASTCQRKFEDDVIILSSSDEECPTVKNVKSKTPERKRERLKFQSGTTASSTVKINGAANSSMDGLTGEISQFPAKADKNCNKTSIVKRLNKTCRTDAGHLQNNNKKNREKSEQLATIVPASIEQKSVVSQSVDSSKRLVVYESLISKNNHIQSTQNLRQLPHRQSGRNGTTVNNKNQIQAAQCPKQPPHLQRRKQPSRKKPSTEISPWKSITRSAKNSQTGVLTKTSDSSESSKLLCKKPNDLSSDCDVNNHLFRLHLRDNLFFKTSTKQAWYKEKWDKEKIELEKLKKTPLQNKNKPSDTPPSSGNIDSEISEALERLGTSIETVGTPLQQTTTAAAVQSSVPKRVGNYTTSVPATNEGNLVSSQLKYTLPVPIGQSKPKLESALSVVPKSLTVSNEGYRKKSGITLYNKRRSEINSMNNLKTPSISICKAANGKLPKETISICTDNAANRAADSEATIVHTGRKKVMHIHPTALPLKTLFSMHNVELKKQPRSENLVPPSMNDPCSSSKNMKSPLGSKCRLESPSSARVQKPQANLKTALQNKCGLESPSSVRVQKPQVNLKTVLQNKCGLESPSSVRVQKPQANLKTALQNKCGLESPSSVRVQKPQANIKTALQNKCGLESPSSVRVQKPQVNLKTVLQNKCGLESPSSVRVQKPQVNLKTVLQNKCGLESPSSVRVQKPQANLKTALQNNFAEKINMGERISNESLSNAGSSRQTKAVIDINNPVDKEIMEFITSLKSDTVTDAADNKTTAKCLESDNINSPNVPLKSRSSNNAKRLRTEEHSSVVDLVSSQVSSTVTPGAVAERNSESSRNDQAKPTTKKTKIEESNPKTIINEVSATSFKLIKETEGNKGKQKILVENHEQDTKHSVKMNGVSSDDLQSKKRKLELDDSSELPKKTVKRDFQNCDGTPPQDIDTVFSTFLSFIRPLLKSTPDEENTIVKKMQSIFKAAAPAYVQSNELRNVIQSITANITKDSKNIFVYLHDFANELRAYKVKKKKNCVPKPSPSSPTKSLVTEFIKSSLPSTSVNSSSTPYTHILDPCIPSTSSMKTLNEPAETSMNEPEPVSNHPNDESSSVDERKEKYIRKLEKCLKRIDKRVKKLQSKELSMDDLNDDMSYYVQEEKLHKRFLKVWGLICHHKNRSSKVGREVEKTFHYKGTRYEAINLKVEKLVNKHKLFPDYSDIYKLVKEENEQSDLGLSLGAVSSEAREIFQDVGRELKRRREKDYQMHLGCYLTDEIDFDEDPADQNEDLKKQLDKNTAESVKKIDKIIDEYVQRQYDTREQAVEVPDDMPTSPSADEDDSEEEEGEEENGQEIGDEIVMITSSSEDSVIGSKSTSESEKLKNSDKNSTPDSAKVDQFKNQSATQPVQTVSVTPTPEPESTGNIETAIYSIISDSDVPTEPNDSDEDNKKVVSSLTNSGRTKTVSARDPKTTVKCLFGGVNKLKSHDRYKKQTFSKHNSSSSEELPSFNFH